MKKRELFSMKKTVKGVITVEMSYLIPIVLLVFTVTVYTVFYYHDKNILIGAAAETAVVGVQMERKPDEEVELNQFFRERVGNKLILFSDVGVSVENSKKWIRVDAYAGSGRRTLRVMQKAEKAEPEKTIRRKRNIEDIVQNGG